MDFIGVFRPLGGFYIPITFTTNRGGLLEIINRGSFDLLVNIPTGGQVIQEARSKCIWRLQDLQGQQVVTIQAQMTHDEIYGWNGTFSPFYDRFYVNVYQAGEIDWYPPVSLTIPQIDGGVQSKTVAANGGTSGAILTIPAAVPGPPLTNGYLQLCGFDVEVTASGTFENHQMQVSGVGGPTSTLEYTIASLVGDTWAFAPRWDPPLTGRANTAIVFTLVVPFTSAITRLNAYWYEVFQ